MNSARSIFTFGLGHAKRSRTSGLACVALVALLGTLAAAIVISREQAKSQIQSSFALRGTASARFAANYLSEQATRSRRAAREFLSGASVSAHDFKLVAATLNSSDAVLLDSSGRVLESFPRLAGLRGRKIAPGYPNLVRAEHGEISTADLIASPVTDAALTSIAVPYQTPKGRRVLSADYSAGGLALDALVAHTISYPEHNVYIVDSAGRLVASSPETDAVTLAQADPELAHSAAHSSEGSVERSPTPASFVTTPVPGTKWNFVIAVPDKRLYASISGPTRFVPWIVFALVTIIGALLVALFARSLADRERLTKLSATMRWTAQTDSLTGLYNRRALTEQLTRAAARARRHDEPLSVLMIDLDRFKQTNDTFGHEAGDQVLCTVADCMREVLRVEDVYGRWGGDEFLVALPMTSLQGAEVTAGRLREAAAAVDLASIGLEQGVPLSIGAACGTHTSPIELIRQADLALYRAKAAGRPRVPASR